MIQINSNKVKSISLVIPLYNEERRISKSLPIIEGALFDLKKKYNIICELIFIDDGSIDQTNKTIRSISKFKNTKFVSYLPNAGKGYAIKKGFEVAGGDYIFFMDADLSTPVKYIEEFLSLADKDIIIGSRKMNPELIKKPQSFLRRKLGHGFTLLTNFVLGTSVTDFTCGFKMFPSDIGKKIFRNLSISRWSFDAEIIYLAKYYGYKIHEIPVEWTNDADTKVNLSKDIIGSLVDLFIIKIRSYKGKYDN